MTPTVTVDRVEVRGTRMSGAIDIKFGFNPSGAQVVWFGGAMRNDLDNVVTINGVEYVIAGVTVTNSPTRGWVIEPNAYSWGMTKVGTYDGATEKARQAFITWAKTQAPRLAEQHHTRWAELYSASATGIDFDKRRTELKKVLDNLEVYETVMAMIAEAPNHRVVRFARSVTCGWENGFVSAHGGYNTHHHTGEAHAFLDIEFEGEWDRAAVLVSGSVHATTFTPMPVSLVQLRHPPELRP